jgi:PKD repeat protein
VSLSEGKLTAEYTPLYFDAVKGVSNESHPYTVRLYFAEMDGKTVGERTFDVNLQGQSVLKNFDVVKEAGAGKRDLMKEFKKVEITDRLKINFTAIKDEPMLSGVEIVGEYNPLDHLANILPIAEIDASVITGTAPLKVIFNGQKSNDPDGQIVNCNWDLGDGRLAKGSVLEHIYAEVGTYQVYLLVRDNRGGLATKSISVTVQPGVPAAFVCSIKATGGDFSKLSDFEAAMKSDMTSSTMLFKLTEVGTSSYNNKSVVFTGGASGMIREVKDNTASIANIIGVPVIGKGNVFGGLKFAIGDVGTPIGKSLLFKVSSKGNCVPANYGSAVTFTGGGKGILKHINGESIAYITECQGDIQIGKATLGSGHSFEISDVGNQVYSIIAECSFDWPNGLEDKVQTVNSTGWVTDALHCVTIRASKGNKFDGKGKNSKNSFTSFAILGELDLRGIPNTRLQQINVDQNSPVAFGGGASINRCVFGNGAICEKTIVANSIVKDFFVGNSKGIINKPVSYFTTSIRDARAPLESFNLISSDVSFINCTGTSFDPGGQPNVEFINCLSTTATKPYNVPGYAELSYINNSVVINGTTATLINGEGLEKSSENSVVAFVNAIEGDFHISAKDTVVKGKGGPGLGADIDGEPRTGPTYDIGADTFKK